MSTGVIVLLVILVVWICAITISYNNLERKIERAASNPEIIMTNTKPIFNHKPLIVRNKGYVVLHPGDYGLLLAESRLYQETVFNSTLDPEEIKLEISEGNEEMLFADGFDEALIGLVERAGLGASVALYDTEKCIHILMKNDGMDEEEAREYFCYNVVGAYMGENTPAFATLYK